MKESLLYQVSYYLAYLELTPPTIAEGGRACVQRGATRVLMMPYIQGEPDSCPVRWSFTRES